VNINDSNRDLPARLAKLFSVSLNTTKLPVSCLSDYGHALFSLAGPLELSVALRPVLGFAEDP
jgi:hypothetical protein